MSERLDRAIQLLREAAQSSPDEPELWQRLFEAVLKQQRPDETPGLFRNMVESTSRRTQIHFDLFQRLVRQGYSPVLERAFDEALSHNPADITSLYGRGLLHQAAGQQREAIEVYRTVLAIAPGAAVALHNMGIALMTMRRIDEALEAARSAASACESMAEPYYLMAVIYLNRQEVRRAVECFERFIAYAPPYLTSYLQHARLTLQMFRGQSQ